MQMASERLEQGRDVAAHQRLAACEPQLAHAQTDEGAAEAIDLFERQQVGAGKERHVFRHAIDATEITTIRYGDLQIRNPAAKRIDKWDRYRTVHLVRNSILDSR